MTKEECLLREICKEMMDQGIHTDRFTQLWLETGLRLDDVQLDVVYKLWQRYEDKNKAQNLNQDIFYYH